RRRKPATAAVRSPSTARRRALTRSPDLTRTGVSIMPELVPHSTLSPLDLTRYTEATRRELYDRVLRIQSVPDADDTEEPAPPFDPEAAGLTVFYILGRWFATWTDL